MQDLEQLERLAHDCLRDHYDVLPVHVEALSVHSFNTVFRVESADGPSVLRVGASERIHPRGVEDTEAEWLEKLADSGFGTARNLAMTDGSRWRAVTHDDVEGERIVSRFSWLDGTVIGSHLDERSAHRAGQLLARLHDHGQDVMATAPIPPQVHGHEAVYFGRANLVATYQSDHGSLFNEAIDRVQQFIDKLWKGDRQPHLPHGDFGPHNLMVHQGQLSPIDFQDLRYGFAVQDLGFTVSDMSRGAPDLVAPLLRGYAGTRELPDLAPDILAVLGAERSLNIMNLALLSPASGIGATLNRHADRIVAWMTSTT